MWVDDMWECAVAMRIVNIRRGWMSAMWDDDKRWECAAVTLESANTRGGLALIVLWLEGIITAETACIC